MQADAFAKVNLSLQVRPPDRTGMHPIRSLVHSVGWSDLVELSAGDEDGFEVEGADVPTDGTNLAMRALAAVRGRTLDRRPVLLRLRKHIPVAAGLGGGSADAAAVLGLAGAAFGVPAADLHHLAVPLGADVPFCLVGGGAWLGGFGEQVDPIPPSDDFALALVVPPLALATPAVYRRWDELGAPSGAEVGRRHLPDSLRDFAPLTNDLVPAAVDLAPVLGDWLADLHRRWGVPVSMSGSGPSLFGYFPTLAEAEDAVAAVTGARAGRACPPVLQGWARRGDGTLP